MEYQIGTIIICLFFSAVFSSSETALFSLNNVQLNKYKDKSKKGNMIYNLRKNPNFLIISILFGNMMVNVLSTTIAENGLHKYFLSSDFKQYSNILTIFIMTFLILIFGEITPKTIAISHSEKISFLVIPLINLVSKIAKPFYFLINKFILKIIFLISKILKLKTPATLNAEELKLAVELGLTDGILVADEEELLKNVFDFSKTKVKSLITPKQDIFAVSNDISHQQLILLLTEHSFSRIPVFADNSNNIIGVLYRKDLLINLEKIKSGFDWIKLIRPVIFVPETKSASSLLLKFKKEQTHIAIIVDEYGSLTGLVTLEDLIEEIFGEIFDKNDKNINYIKKIGTRKYRVLGRMELDYFNQIFSSNIQENDINTLGGYVLKEIGDIPKSGDSIKINNNIVTVENIEKNNIKNLIIHKLK